MRWEWPEGNPGLVDHCSLSIIQVVATLLVVEVVVVAVVVVVVVVVGGGSDADVRLKKGGTGA